jgi:sugar phosphate isomerase/epimerase
MNRQNRRAFLQTSTGVLAVGLSPAGVAALNVELSPDLLPAGTDTRQTAPAVTSNDGKKPLRLGLIINISVDPDTSLAKVHDLGLPTCQAFVDNFTPGLAERLRQAVDKNAIEVTSLVVGGPGKEIWDFYHGPLTIGLVPRETRAARIAHIKKASDFAKQCGIPAVQTHCGFIPENPSDELYRETVTAIREVAAYCKRNGQNFRYETGQETPITLVRAIQDVGVDNQGVNFDLANLILYGKANPVDAIELLGPFVQGIHAKDGLWPPTRRNSAKKSPSAKARWIFRALSRV